MANALYSACKEAFLNGNINLTTDNIKVVLVDTADYTVDLATHNALDDIPALARVATSGNLAGKSITGGVFDANDVTLTTVTGDQSEAVVIYQDSGVESTSRLIAYIDTATGLPITPAGGDIDIVWDDGANRIFAL